MEGANVSGQVACHTRSLPLLQGTSVTPSGRLPSERERPVGSSLEGKWAADIAQWTINVVDSSVALMTALTPFAAESVHGSAINLHTTVVTGVGTAKGRS